MATTLATAPPPDPSQYRLSVDQYMRMIDAGILSEDDPVELIEGVLVQKMTRKPPHDSAADRLEHALRAVLPVAWMIRSQKAIALSDGLPEPDLAVVAGPVGRYDDHHPTPPEIALVIEVAETSLDTDRGRKLRSYARAGIPAYWIVNLEDWSVEVYTHPKVPKRGVPAYRTRADYLPGQAVPVALAGTRVGEIRVDAILPRA